MYIRTHTNTVWSIYGLISGALKKKKKQISTSNIRVKKSIAFRIG